MAAAPSFMPSAFPFNASPFDCLTPDEQRLVRASVDIAYFPEGAVVLDAGSAPTHLFVIIKGYVTQTEGEEVLATYGPEDSFDPRLSIRPGHAIMSRCGGLGFEPNF